MMLKMSIVGDWPSKAWKKEFWSWKSQWSNVGDDEEFKDCCDCEPLKGENEELKQQVDGGNLEIMST